MTDFQDVPIEIIVQILSFLPVEDLIKARMVSSEWGEIIKSCSLIRNAFNKNQISKYLDVICFRFDFIKQHIEQISFGDIKQLSKIYCEMKSMEGIIFLVENFGECDEEKLRELVVNHNMEMPEYLKKRYVNVDRIYQSKISGIFNDNVLWHASFQTALNHSHETAIEWLQLDTIIRKRGINLEDAQLIMEQGLWDRCKDMFISDYGGKNTETMINLGNTEVTNYILDHTGDTKFTIRYPNENAIILCGTRMEYNSVNCMAELGRFDLVHLIISICPKYHTRLFHWYVINHREKEAIEYLGISKDILDFHEIHRICIAVGNLDLLLEAYKIYGITFPECHKCNGGRCCLDIFRTNFSVAEIKQFMKLAERNNCGARKSIGTFKIQKKNANINQIFSHPLARELAVWISINDLNRVNWNTIMKPELQWMVNRFGLDALNQKMKKLGIDPMHNYLVIGDLETAIWIMQTGLTYDKNISNLKIQCYNKHQNLEEVKQMITNFCNHLGFTPKLVIGDHYYLSKNQKISLHKWYNEKFNQIE